MFLKSCPLEVEIIVKLRKCFFLYFHISWLKRRKDYSYFNVKYFDSIQIKNSL